MSPRTESFPLVIRAGSSVVKIYRDRKPSRDYYRVVFHLGGKRHRLNFRDLTAQKPRHTPRHRNWLAEMLTPHNFQDATG